MTGNECWGIHAKEAKFEFYLNEALQGSFETDLSAGQVFLFDLPGDRIIANRIEVWNLTPDPPGINNDGTMEFIYAGIDQEAVNAVSDLEIFADTFGSTSEDSNYDPRCDFDEDGDVDGSDLSVFATDFDTFAHSSAAFSKIILGKGRGRR